MKDELVEAQNETEAELLDGWREAFDRYWHQLPNDTVTSKVEALKTYFRGRKEKRHHDGVIMYSKGAQLTCYRVLRSHEVKAEKKLEASYQRRAKA